MLLYTGMMELVHALKAVTAEAMFICEGDTVFSLWVSLSFLDKQRQV